MLLFMGSLTACTLPNAGPTAKQVDAASKATPGVGPRFALVDVDANVVSAMERWMVNSLQGSFGAQRPATNQAIGIGDTVQIVIWEAAAGGLFSTSANDRLAGSHSAVIPNQVVGSDGAVTVPYAGRVAVAGRSPQQVEEVIIQRLQAKAIEPQVLVTITKNVSNTVTVVSEVTGGARVPLTTRGDRILDVIAEAGGTRAPAYETFIALSRDGRSVRIPLEAVLGNPKENIFVRPGDVVSVEREPQTFTAVGATGQNAVLPFAATGITLDEAIGRAGGLNDLRADPGGVFVIRYERPSDYDQLGLTRPSLGPMEQVPVMYRINMSDPNSFFLARQFPIRNKDILFVSNAPATQVQKAISILLPFIGLGATTAATAAVVK
jgi:polysaccharide export outer membrane protein